jgi:DNA-binding NarL/FixJ family response regulator
MQSEKQCVQGHPEQPPRYDFLAALRADMLFGRLRIVRCSRVRRTNLRSGKKGISSTGRSAGDIIQPMISVLLADDHAIVAEGLAALLRTSFQLLGVVNDGRALVNAALELHPDVIVTDITMPSLNGLDAIREIKRSRPEQRLIVLTMHSEPDLAVQCFRSGASGYLLKTSPGEELIDAIRQVARGRVYLTPLIAKDFISILLEAQKTSSAEDDILTPRQREILQLIAEGRTMKEIASLLHISQRTAESHKYEMMQTLGLETTAALIQYAIRIKLVPG